VTHAVLQKEMQIFIVRDRQANITYPGALKETD